MELDFIVRGRRNTEMVSVSLHDAVDLLDCMNDGVAEAERPWAVPVGRRLAETMAFGKLEFEVARGDETEILWAIARVPSFTGDPLSSDLVRLRFALAEALAGAG